MVALARWSAGLTQPIRRACLDSSFPEKLHHIPRQCVSSPCPRCRQSALEALKSPQQLQSIGRIDNRSRHSRPPHAASSSSPSHSDRSRWISGRCRRSNRSTSNTLGRSFVLSQGGGDHQSEHPCSSRRNCNSRSRLIVTHWACVVRSIGFLVHARHSSQPSRCFKSRNPSSCRNRAANSSTICKPVSPTAELTSVNRFLYPSTLATTALTGTSSPDTRHRHTTSFQRTFRRRP